MQRLLIGGTLVAVLLAATGPGAAQSIAYGRDGIRVQEEPGLPKRAAVDRITEHQAVGIARREGLRKVEDIRQTRLAIRVDGRDSRGVEMSVNVDRVSGKVLSVD